LSAEQVARVPTAKSLIARSFRRALPLVPRAIRAGLLVDEQAGRQVLLESKDRDFVLGLPVEKADLDLFEFQYGQDFRSHIREFSPDFVKALIRYNVDDNSDGRELQLERLRTLSSYLGDTEIEFMFELVVRPSAGQLASVAGDRRRYEDELRPSVVYQSIEQIIDAGIHVDMWKIEGISDPNAAKRVSDLALGGGSRECLILGGGASVDRVEGWLDVASSTPGFNGFVIGRSIWRDPVRAWLVNPSVAGAVEAEIAQRYCDFIEKYSHVPA